MRLPLLALPLSLILACAGETDGAFKDELKFGTGVGGTGFTLVGESTTFDLLTTRSIWFRLESAANFEGRFVRLYLNGLDQRDFAACANPDAHICLSQFSVSNAGTYEVKAYLVKTNVDLGEETLVTSSTLTLR